VKGGVLRMGRNVRTVAEGAKADDVPSVTVRTLNTVATAAHNNISPDDYEYIAGLRARGREPRSHSRPLT